MSTARVPNVNQEQVTVYNLSEVARLFGVSVTTVAKWLQKGHLTEDTSVRGLGRFVTAGSVRALREKRERQANEASA